MKYIFTTLLYLFSEIALACYCEPPSASDAYSRSVEVLYVEVTNVEFIKGDSLMRVHYEVLETFKTDGSTIQYVSKEDDSCGPKFITGSTYILYVPESRVVSDCSGTQLVITNIVRKSGIERLNHLRAN